MGTSLEDSEALAPQKVDLLILNGTVVDGTGSPQFTGDIAISDGSIVYISGNGKPRITAESHVATVETIDASGKLVCPGWIDVHTHLDAQVTWDSAVTPVAANGVTTVLMGNCGVGFAPCRKEQRHFIMSLMEGVEDIPLGAMTAGMKWEWETFPEFLDVLAKRSFAIDVGAFVSHGPVRAWVMGERANAMDKPGGPQRSPITAQEIEHVAAVVKNAIEAGAIGFSTSRTLLHRDSSGVLVPGTMAPEGELLAIGRAMAEAGGGVFEMASDFMCCDDEPHGPQNHAERLKHFGREWIWMQKLSKLYSLPLQFCIGIPSAMKYSKGYRSMLEKMEAANAQGCQVQCQAMVRPQAVQLCWDSMSHPFVESPTFMALRRDLRIEASKQSTAIPSPSVWLPDLRRRLCTDQALRRKIIDETTHAANSGEDGHHGIVLPNHEDAAGNLNGAITKPGAFAKMFSDQSDNIFRWDETYEPERKDSVKCVADANGLSVFDVLYDWLCECDGCRVCSLFFMNYHDDSNADCLEMLLFPGAIPGLGDSGAHLGFLCDPTSHTYLLSYYVRDRTRGPRLPLEQAVKIHSADCADAFGLDDRGRLLEGKLADINVIDLANLKIHCPKFLHDLPENAARWVQTCEGIICTIKSGIVTQRSGKPTGALPGTLVRGRAARERQAGRAPPRVPTENSWATSIAGIAGLFLLVAVGTEMFRKYGFWRGVASGVCTAFASGLATGRFLGGSIWSAEVRWEFEQKFLEFLVTVVGPQRLETLGSEMFEKKPLKSRFV